LPSPSTSIDKFIGIITLKLSVDLSWVSSELVELLFGSIELLNVSELLDVIELLVDSELVTTCVEFTSEVFELASLLNDSALIML
jgi:hypothetical protein